MVERRFEVDFTKTLGTRSISNEKVQTRKEIKFWLVLYARETVKVTNFTLYVCCIACCPLQPREFVIDRFYMKSHLAHTCAPA
ncbi:hypothetical protein L596_013793 [Steinernema carpocapsae]|uniref:Uncharacterized protein n=1 Tax=Steinernema carpocapsae TaxID=34508 RepID=A0A4U5P193_STECR|nr:hypothetical protein L596_013793 [Steinernema carpocapsae]